MFSKEADNDTIQRPHRIHRACCLRLLEAVLLALSVGLAVALPVSGMHIDSTGAGDQNRVEPDSDRDVRYRGGLIANTAVDTGTHSVYLPVVIPGTSGAHDLAVTGIQVPAVPVFNAPMPITITIRNNSTMAVAGQWFDTDIYIDPEHVSYVTRPLTSPFPPGDFKLWLNYLGPNSTATLVQNVVLDGAQDHRVYVRTNTSAAVPESDVLSPTNNITSVLVIAAGCGASVDEALTTDVTPDNTFSSGWAGVAFGDGGPGSQSISNDVINLTSDGSSTVRDDDVSGGYYFYYQTVAGDFDVSVHALGQTGTNYGASFGLEVRDSAAGTARKVELFQTRANTMQYAYRALDSGPVTYGAVTGTSNDLPVWLRIARSGNDFTLYYAYTSNTPPRSGDWVVWATYKVAMSDSVLVGLANASYVSGTSNTVTFDNFHLCIDPGNATSCGTVRERGGLVVLDATNFVRNVSRISHQWQRLMTDGRRAMQALPDNGVTVDTGYSTGSPELQYRVNIQTPGDYYVWVYGGGPDTGGDTLNVGIDGIANADSDRLDLAEGVTTPAWTRATTDGPVAMIHNVTTGIHTLNVWMREDGALFYKILLTTSPNYIPTGDIAQSASDASGGQAPYPPGMVACTPPGSPLLQNGGFEDPIRIAWTIPSPLGSSIVSSHPYAGNFSLVLDSYRPGGGFLQPYIWQRFTMPDWITSTTTMNLRLWKSVDQLSQPEAMDTLKVMVRTDDVTPTAVSTATIIARGDEITGYPDHYVSGEWNLVSAMRAVGQDPANYAGQNLRLYIYDDSNDPSCLSPGPTCFMTSFYIDDVELEVCTSQPVPALDPAKATIRGNVQVSINGVATPKQGVRVWAYRQDGAMYTTYSIQDSTYGFYLVDPGDYTLYAEWWEGTKRYSALTNIQAFAGMQSIRPLTLY